MKINNVEKVAIFDRKGPDGITSVYPSLLPTKPVSGFRPLVPFETTEEPYGSMVVYSSGFTPAENLVTITAYLIMADEVDTPESFVEFHSQDICNVLGIDLDAVYASIKAVLRRIRRGKAPKLKALIVGVYDYLDGVFQSISSGELAADYEAYEERLNDLQLAFLSLEEFYHQHGLFTTDEYKFFFPDDEDID